MHLYFIGFLAWAIVIGAVLRLGAIGFKLKALTRIQAALWVVMLITACLVMFRPHEDLFGGQDQGSYVNSAYTYMREGSLAHEDDLLSQVTPEVRKYFRYFGHGNKNHPSMMGVLKTDFETARQLPYFMPAYAILAGSVGVPLGAGAVLYVAPVFAILAAFALSVLAFIMLKSRAAQFAVFAMYILNPVVCWHGRGARPELVASFLLLAAVSLLAASMTREREGRKLDILLGSACLAIAPLFHVTAWMAVLPLGLVIGAAAACGNRRLLLAVPVFVVGICIFIFQTAVVTDCYQLQSIAGILFRRPAILAAMVVAAGLLVTGLCFVCDGKRPGQAISEFWRKQGRAVVLLGGVICALLTVCFAAVSAGQIDPAGLRTTRIMQVLRCTEVAPYVSIVTPVVAVLGLAGWCVFMIIGGPMKRERVILAAAFLPGLILMGRMPISMYFLRRALLYMVPATVLGIAVLLHVVERLRPRLHSSVLPLLALTAAVCGLWGRTSLCAMTDYRGLVSHFSAVAEAVKKDDGILLCEYSRIAAPLHHVFGVPALSIDNEHISDYRPLEQEWLMIMKSRAGRKAFFATPFEEEPLSDLFVFNKVLTKYYEGLRLVEQKTGVPEKTQLWKNRIHLYEMVDRSEVSSPSVFPANIAMGASNMGKRLFTKPKWKEKKAEGMSLVAGTGYRLKIPRSDRVLFFVLAAEVDESSTLFSRVEASGMIASCANIGGGWHAVELVKDKGRAKYVDLVSERDSLLSQVVSVRGNDVEDVPFAADAGRMISVTIPRFRARWARNGAQVLVPVPGDGGMLCVYAAVPGEIEGPINLTVDGLGGEPVVAEAPGGWRWYVWPVAGSGSDFSVRWITFSSDHTLDPGIRQFPSDLSLSIGSVNIIR